MRAYTRLVLLKTIIVNCTDGTSFRGVLYRERGPLLILKQAEYLEPGAEPVLLDGDTIIDRARIAFVQAP